MKNSHIIRLFTIAILLISTPDVSYGQTNEDLGSKTFEFLTKYAQYDDDFYQEFIITGAAYLEAMNLENEVSEVNADKWYQKMKTTYDNTRKAGFDLGIKWSKIRYENYTSEILEDYGIKIEKGEIFFRYKRKTYRIETVYLFTKNGPRLVDLNGLSEVDTLPQF